MDKIYLDANSSCGPLKEAKQEILRTLNYLGNPSSFHHHGRSVRKILDEARKNLSLALTAQEKTIFFTSGASESNRIFIDSLKKMVEEKNTPLKVLSSVFEHPSLLNPLLELKDNNPNFQVDFIPVTLEGRCQIELIDFQKYHVVICTQAHNETGILPPLDKIIPKLDEKTIFMSDISQSLARMPTVFDRCDVLTCSAQKMGGFAGSGALVLRNNALVLPPPYLGGGQEKGIRPGTESVLTIAAFGAAAAEINSTRTKFHLVESLRNDFERQVLSSLTGCQILGQDLPRLPNTSAIIFHNENPDTLRIKMDMLDLCVGFGSACSGLAPKASFALEAMSLPLIKQKLCVRFSFDYNIQEQDIKETASRLMNL